VGNNYHAAIFILTRWAVVGVLGLSRQAGHEEQTDESGHCQQNSHLARTLGPHGGARCLQQTSRLSNYHAHTRMYLGEREED